MKHLRELLAADNSVIAQFLRSSLHGLEASLKKTQEQFPQDPGADICDEVLEEIQSLLQPSSVDNATNQSQNTVATTKEYSDLEDTQQIKSDELKLTSLRDAFNPGKDKDLIKYLGDFQLQSQADSELWEEIQHKILRLPKEIANTWKKRVLELAQQAEAEEDISNNLQLRFKGNEEIYPGLKGSIQAQGLSLSENASLDLQVLQENRYEHLSEDVKLLACLVSICISFVDRERDLHHALETVFKFNIMPLVSNPEQRKKYIEALKERFQRTLRAEESGDSLTVLKAWINIDEAINSLVFVPPADSDSWWGEFKKQSRRILVRKVKKAKEEDHDVRIQELSGMYADIHNLSSGYDLPLKVGGIPGEVQACLRVYARINGEKFPGRVIYRSSK
ncbi:hypothetical protein [Nostoc sp. 'Peltigera membranacea cyanobiont' 232]|uniref:hypothetical protein n=1 Tax=Nostoc sp. 'Peltigera membranacea cyanobiont' 232 TaxID=2014531 RepID=UPI000B957541|nr:hypothetical protein [Nostoc sp. 'Peltigera membranacea cyanobiont' 232]OYE03077.1 hypothetical protein CDG79_20355 [Nostoc sp. 'Peltigera membranacea cyanobiont' 232]